MEDHIEDTHEAPRNMAKARRIAHLVDVYGYTLSGINIALGLTLLHACSIMTSGVAGLALLVAEFLPFNPSLIFGLLNIPFFFVGLRLLGTAFFARSVVVSILIVIFGAIIGSVIDISSVHPLAAALIGGSLIGTGVLFSARHSAGVGGTVVLMICLNRKFGWNMGLQGALFDASLVLLAVLVLGVEKALWSALSALAVNLVLMVFPVRATSPR